MKNGHICFLCRFMYLINIKQHLICMLQDPVIKPPPIPYNTIGRLRGSYPASCSSGASTVIYSLLYRSLIIATENLYQLRVKTKLSLPSE